MAAWVPIAAAVGGAILGNALKPKVPDPSGAIKETADAQKEIAAGQLELQKEQFEFNKQNYKEMMPFIKGIYESQAAIATANDERAQEFHDYWQTTFKPLEQKIVQQAQDYNTENRRELMAQKAQGDIGTAYQGLRGQLQRSLGKYGINPSSDRFATLNAGLMRDEALQKAGAMTNARDRAEALGQARMVEAAGLGRNLPGAASGAYQVAIGAGNAAVDNSQVPGQMMNAGYGQARAGLGAASSTYNQALTGYGMDWNQRVGQYNMKNERMGDILGFGGQIAGMFEDGGKVNGIGGPKDDTVPAMLSDGEYVVPAAVVKKLGVEHFDKLIAKHGDKGNKQALAHRKGVSRRH